MIVTPGSASRDLGHRVGELLGVKVAPVEFKRFPDGESYLRFTEDLRGEDVIIVQTTGPPQDSNFLQLLLLADTARDLGARTVTAVVPYVAYGRQDHRFRPRETVSSETVFKLLKTVELDHFVTFDYHSPEMLSRLDCHVENLSAIPSLAQFMARHGLRGAFSLAPDEGAMGFAKAASEVLGGGWGWLRKMRDRVTGKVSFRMEALSVEGRDAVVFDDIISTGATMASAIRILKKQGAGRVYAACVHPLLLGDAAEKILGEGALEIVGTDCVQSPVSVVSVAPLVAEALERCLPV